jgi:uncharacterized protein (TIGR00255 family)
MVMIQSMTGFASRTLALTNATGEKTNIAISLKTLNYRFFETTFKLPYMLSSLETKLIKICKQKLIRGHVYLTVHVSNPNVFRSSVQPALTIVQGYIDAIQKIKARHAIVQPITLDHILSLPNVFVLEESDVDQDVERMIFDTINELIDSVIAARAVEGEVLSRDLSARIAVMTEEINAITQAYHRLIESQKEKINKMAQEVASDENLQANARQEALYALLDKMDIHEEIIRFKSHLSDMQEQLASSALEQGKRLDFTLQELGREINTIAAKCSDATISKRAINTKVEIEKAREQVQNIV